VPIEPIEKQSVRYRSYLVYHFWIVPFMLKSVFRIRDILIRTRILGSVQWITDPVLDTDPDPVLFVSAVAF